MGNRKFQKDIKKIEEFLNHLGMELVISKNTDDPDARAFFYFGDSNPRVEIFESKNDNKKLFLLTLLHEAAHAYYFFLKKFKYSKVFDRINGIPFEALDKRDRKSLYDAELNELVYMVDVWSIAGINYVTLGEVIDQAFEDVSMYRFYVRHGYMPDVKQTKKEVRLLIRSKEFKIFDRC